jgi:glycosyltransferase involved in cell wall biosynthesis
MIIKNKICVISSPVDTYSGYGGRSRDIVKSLIAIYPEWDIKLLSQRWGNTRSGYLEDHEEHDLKSRVIPKLESKPDIWIQITVPNEFQPVGQFNIGITAGIETTVADYSWIEGCNRMHLNLVSSKHSKDVLTQYTYELKNNDTGVVSKIKCTSTIEVLFEGLDLTKYYPIQDLPNSEIVNALDSIEEDFCFLIVGHWLQGDFGQDRKNMGGTIKCFLEAFKDKPKPPALIIKTQSANASIMDRNTMLDKIEEAKSKVSAKNLPNIYLLHGEISDDYMSHLYNHPKIKAMTTLFKGEGFGRPLLEFAAVNKPILSSFWSGPVDFLDKEFTYFVGGKLELIHKSAQVSKMLLDKSQWFTANEIDAIKGYKQIYSDYKKALTQAKRQGHKVRLNFSLEKMSEQLKNYIDNNIKSVPFQVPLDLLNLPNLKKIS